jgi:general secretion pathway protein K
VLVLWVLTLLTVMALGLTTLQRTESALTRNQIDGARFRAAADAAINLAVLELLRTPTQWDEEQPLLIPDGTPWTLTFNGEDLTVRLYNEGSRLDLNKATREQLAALIELAQGEAGYDEAERDRLADAILDWRDADDMTQLNGAEDGDYDAENLSYGARDEPFRSVAELHQVLGMNRELYRRLASDLTVNNPSGRVDQQFASAAVLAVLQNIPLEEAELQVEERNLPTVPGAQPAAPSRRGGPLYRARVTLARGEAASRTMEALLEVQRGSARPVRILWRRYGIIGDDS